MLLITRRPGEAFTFQIGEIKVRVLIMERRGSEVLLGIEAPRAVKVLREELEGNERFTFAP